VAEVEGRSSPTLRRRQLGAQLRVLRIERRLTVEQVADQLLVSPSKISRIETGHRGASARDIRDLSDLYQVDDDTRQELFRWANEARQRGWWQPLHLPYSTFVGLEAAADSISDFSLGLLPGLLQTPDYARALVRAAEPDWSAELLEQHLQARRTRQEVLTSGTLANYTVVMDEAAIHRVVGGPSVMTAQLDRLVQLNNLENIALHLIPYDAGALPWGINKFIILDFAEHAVSTVIFVETLTQDLYLDDPSDVDKYKDKFEAVLGIALSKDATSRVISRARDNFRRSLS
jgi:transcriptional regulator with XRE-family HTH domain